MGLSERKTKQKIGADPRNLAWAENAAKFGHTYLAKHGWTPSTGLGVAGDGRVSHIAVAQKLDQLGIGAGRPDGPDAIAWKQAKEFEGLLERLNAAGAGGDVVEERAEESEEIGGDEQEDKARRKERRREEKRKAKEAKAALEASSSSGSSTPAEENTAVTAPAPRRLAHRARFLAAKRLSGTSSAALSEILGVAPTPTSTSAFSTPSISTPTPAPTSTPLTAIPILDDANQITTSAQSVADYFRDKMRARAQALVASGAAGVGSTPVVVFEEPEVKPEVKPEEKPEENAPRAGLGSSRQNEGESEVDARPMRLGFASAGTGSGLGFKRAASPPPSTPDTQTPPLTTTDSESKKETKRKRKEKDQVASLDDAIPAPAAPLPAPAEEGVDFKAAKRARKEARRAARAMAEQEEVGTEDRPKKKKQKSEVV